MKEKDFENLKASLQEVVEIERGEREPSRRFVVEKFTPEDIQTIIDALRIGADTLDANKGWENNMTQMEVIRYVIGVIQEVKRSRE